MANYESRKVGDHEFSFPTFPLRVQVVEYAWDDLSSDVLKIPVEAGDLVLAVAHQVTTPFAGGTPALDIGDGTDADFWIVNTEMDMTADDNFFNSLGSAQPGSAGFPFTAAGNVVLTHAASLTAGAGTVFLLIVDTRTNWRTAGEIP
jgi:hypothetical protein